MEKQTLEAYMINLLIELLHCGAKSENWDVCLHRIAIQTLFLLVLSCSLTSDEVTKLYWKGGAEANESTDIVFLSKDVRTFQIQLQN